MGGCTNGNVVWRKDIKRIKGFKKSVSFLLISQRCWANLDEMMGNCDQILNINVIIFFIVQMSAVPRTAERLREVICVCIE